MAFRVDWILYIKPETGRRAPGPILRAKCGGRATARSYPLLYFFLGVAPFLAEGRAGAVAVHGVTCRLSIFAFSVSIVSMKGSAVNAEGTPSHWISPAVGLPVSGASSFSVITVGAFCWFGSGTLTSNSFERHAGLPSTTVPFIFGTAAFFSWFSKYEGPSGLASWPLILRHIASCGYCDSNSFSLRADTLVELSIVKFAGGIGFVFAAAFNSSRPSVPPW